MTTFPHGGAAQVFRDFLEDGNPVSDRRQPPKYQIRELLSLYEQVLNTLEAATGDPDAIDDILDAFANKADKSQTLAAAGFAAWAGTLGTAGTITVAEALEAIANAGLAGPEGGAMSARRTRSAIDKRRHMRIIDTDDYPDHLPSTARRVFHDPAGYLLQIFQANGPIVDTRGGGSGGVMLARPAGHTWDSGIVVFEDADGTISTNYDHLARRPFLPSAADHLVYVDAAAAGGGDGSATTPYNALSSLSGLSGNVHVRLKGGTYGISKLPGALVSPANLSIEVMPGTGPAILTSAESGLVWTPHATVAGAYSATLASAPGSVSDDQYPDIGPTDFEGNALFPGVVLGEALAVAADNTALAAPGTWRYASGAVHVHTRDGRAPDSKVRVFRAVTMLSYATTGTLWISGEMHFLGGTVTLASGISSPRMKIHLNRVLFAYSKYDQNAVSFLGAHDAYAIRSACMFGALDGWNYHGTTPHFFEERCAGQRNGWGGGGANNGSTCHDAGAGLRVLGGYGRNRNRNVHDVGDSTTWNIVCDASYATEFNAGAHSGIGFASGFGGHATTANKMWLYRCTARGNLFDLSAPQDVIYTSGILTDGTVESGSTITPYEQA
jgi:hypothetical protein